MVRFGGVHTFSCRSTECANLFGTYLDETLNTLEYIVWGWPWQILCAVRAVATAGKPGDILFFLSGKQRIISPISRQPNLTKFEYNTSIGVAMKTFGAEL